MHYHGERLETGRIVLTDAGVVLSEHSSADWGPEATYDDAAELAQIILQHHVGFRVDPLVAHEFRARDLQVLPDTWDLSDHQVEQTLFEIKMTHRLGCLRCADAGHYNDAGHSKTCTCQAGASFRERQSWIDSQEL